MSPNDLKTVDLKVQNLLVTLKYTELKSHLAEIKSVVESNDSWKDIDSYTKSQKEYNKVLKDLEPLEKLVGELENLKIALEIGSLEEVTDLNNKVALLIENIESRAYFNGPFDDQSAILNVHAGAGGLDAQDWASMLASMYQTFAQNQKWDATIISLSSGEEAGIKSICIEIKGELAYGYLKEEAGVHRLVRLSPFNSGNTRETSFALVEVLPSDIQKVVQTPAIDEKDIRWDYFMASGKGGQSVNTTYSAVRLVHIPTGISISCQNERSQQQNKQQAMKLLENKLATLELQKHNEFKNELKGVFVLAEWGSQIRSYVLHPYKLVKDHRTGFETKNVEDVIEKGNLIPFIMSNKQNKKLD